MVAGAMIMQFWFPDTPAWVWSIGFTVLLFCLNMMSTRAYWEAEYWFAGIKVVTCIVFLIVSTAFILGIGGFFGVLMIAGFFFQGTELVGIAAGESENPETNISKAIKSVFLRILIFYVGALIVIVFLLPYTDENLLKASGEASFEAIAVSPFTLVFKRAGL